jgi:hypothetical protein
LHHPPTPKKGDRGWIWPLLWWLEKLAEMRLAECPRADPEFYAVNCIPSEFIYWSPNEYTWHWKT